MNVVILKVSVLICAHFVSSCCILYTCGPLLCWWLEAVEAKTLAVPGKVLGPLLLSFLLFICFGIVLRESLLGTHYVVQAALKFMAIFLSPVF